MKPDIVAVEDKMGAPENEKVLSVYDGRSATILPDGKVQVRNSDIFAYQTFRDIPPVGWGEKKYFFGELDGQPGFDLQIVETNNLFTNFFELKTYRNIIPDNFEL